MRFDRAYMDLIVRWLWLIVLSGVVAASAAFWVSRQDKLEYAAKARLIVGPGYSNPNPTINDLRTSGQLMQMYAELATTRQLMEEVVHALDIDVDPAKLDNHLDIKANTETLILTIQATDKDPVRAVAMANGVAEALVRLPEGSMAGVDESVNSRVTDVKAIIDRSNAMIKRLDAALDSATDLEQQKLIRDQIKDESNRLTENHQTLATLYDSMRETDTNRIQIIEPATEATPVASTARLNILVAALAGVLLALLIALALEYIDRTVKTAEQLARVVPAPVLVGVEHYTPPPGVGREGVIAKALPESRPAESYRRLSAKLLLADHGAPSRCILICSAKPDAAADSAEVAANLAVTLAEAGRRVVLVDADLHRTRIGERFGLPERGGLTDALGGKAGRPDGSAIAWAAGLTVITAGPATPDAFKLLTGPAFGAFLDDLKDQADLVLVVGAPLLAFADGLMLASRADGVLLVARGGQTKLDTLADAASQVQAAGGRLVGVVLSGASKGETLALPPLPLAPRAPGPLRAGLPVEPSLTPGGQG